MWVYMEAELLQSYCSETYTGLTLTFDSFQQAIICLKKQE